MRIPVRSLVLLHAAWVAAACAGNPQPGAPGYRYNVSGAYDANFVVEGTSYAGTASLTTASGGAVTGTVAVTSPMTLNMNAAGTVVADSLRVSLPYTMPDGCNGTAYLSGTVTVGGDSAGGVMSVDDSCGGTLGGTFTLTR